MLLLDVRRAAREASCVPILIEHQHLSQAFTQLAFYTLLPPPSPSGSSCLRNATSSVDSYINGKEKHIPVILVPLCSRFRFFFVLLQLLLLLCLLHCGRVNEALVT